MHFTYTYIPHDIEKLHGYLDFLFYEVWLKAEGDFGIEKLDANEELKKIYEDLGNSEGEWPYFFNSSIERIYAEFLVLDDNYKALLEEKYSVNNNIEELCSNVKLIPILYDDIALTYPNLAHQLKSFYSKLYGSSSPFNLKIFGFLNGALIENYDYQFMDSNDLGICPFCGLNDLKGNNHNYREAYDHYIPKSKYPFNSVNFRNLAPMCHECNSTYKTTKNPLFNIDPLSGDDARRRAFYPYGNDHPKLNIEVHLKSSDIINMGLDQIKLSFYADREDFDEEIESWLRVFNIEERYKAVLRSPNDGIAWFQDIHGEFENFVALGGEDDPEVYYQNRLKSAKKFPLTGKGFLHSKFLEECKGKGLFEKH